VLVPCGTQCLPPPRCTKCSPVPRMVGLREPPPVLPPAPLPLPPPCPATSHSALPLAPLPATSHSPCSSSLPRWALQPLLVGPRASGGRQDASSPLPPGSPPGPLPLCSGDMRSGPVCPLALPLPGPAPGHAPGAPAGSRRTCRGSSAAAAEAEEGVRRPSCTREAAAACHPDPERTPGLARRSERAAALRASWHPPRRQSPAAAPGCPRVSCSRKAAHMWAGCGTATWTEVLSLGVHSEPTDGRAAPAPSSPPPCPGCLPRSRHRYAPFAPSGPGTPSACKPPSSSSSPAPWTGPSPGRASRARGGGAMRRAVSRGGRGAR